MKLLFYFIAVVFYFLPSFLVAQRLNKKAIGVCEDAYGQCVDGLNATISFQNCTQTFNSCLDKNAYLSPRKPLQCFKAEAAWDVTRLSIGASAVILSIAYGVLPAVLKGIAKLINKSKINCPKFGNCLLFMTDENEDGKVDARELIQPQTLISAFSLAGFLYAWQDAIRIQAECDYAKEQKPAGD